MDLLPPDPAESAHKQRFGELIDRLVVAWNETLSGMTHIPACTDPALYNVRQVVAEIHREASPFAVLLLADVLREQPVVRYQARLRHFVGHTFQLIEFPRNAAMKNAADSN